MVKVLIGTARDVAIDIAAACRQSQKKCGERLAELGARGARLLGEIGLKVILAANVTGATRVLPIRTEVVPKLPRMRASDLGQRGQERVNVEGARSPNVFT